MQLRLHRGRTAQTRWRSGFLSRAIASFALLCAMLLALPGIAAADAFPGPIPAWYSNQPQGTLIYQDASVRIVWEHSYVYRAPGDEALYWYAQVSYQNIIGKPLAIVCNGPVLVYGTVSGSNTEVLENMRGTPNAGYVAADETLCTHNPNYSRAIPPGGKHYDWAIFHNVPWKVEGSLASLTWGPFGPSGWADPWSSPTSRILGDVQLPAPVECPQELVNLKTCLISAAPGGDLPQGIAPNLIVLVHGCCTDEAGVWEWRALADQIVGEILNSKPSVAWEVVVWDWSADTPDLDFPGAYYKAPNQGDTLATIINNLDAYFRSINEPPYQYIHLIAHSAGAKLIQEAATKIAAEEETLPYEKRLFIHLTFLDAYRPFFDNYGFLTNYSSTKYYAEHYVDKGGPPNTDDILPYASNFDITDWPTTPVGFCQVGSIKVLGTQEKCYYGHHWPRYWYEKSVTPHWYDQASGFRFGYPLSLEGGNSNIGALSTKYPPGACTKLLDVGKTANC